MKRLKFPLDCEIIKLKPLYKKGSKTHPKAISPFHFWDLIQKL